ncbi:redox-sensing transcriptional repressor Rex [Nocardia cyriacigeorgica]|uniref:redox-sensing transcriptional repressor Rex n=1 Tax=Nocardia cyriacigeorgica TaxID=135487 RepID=UPI0018944FA3|nr:redox-sensing transcriptional repressor Rex [Nocardia cyriacigeorgica]MBF6412455.1 redox-sensing transcriptional repressor Rex [Nocardia cyriacigeorgica]
MTEHHEAPGGASKALRSSDGPEGGSSRNHEAANRTHKDIPQATVARLATYLRVLAMLADDGVLIVSSEELAVAAGVNSAKLRKDLSFLGPNGVRGVGYDVAKLRTRIEDVLGLSEGHRVVLVGAGNLGRALVGYGGFRRRGFTVVGLFDNDPALIGRTVSGLRVRDAAELDAVIATLEPTIAVIAVPDDAAQQVCDALVAAGLQSILSFAPCELVVPATVEVRRVDLAVEMQMLSFERVRNAETDRWPSDGHGDSIPVAHPLGSGRVARRAASTHPQPAHPGRAHPAAATQHPATPQHPATSHSATEPTSKGSVVTP